MANPAESVISRKTHQLGAWNQRGGGPQEEEGGGGRLGDPRAEGRGISARLTWIRKAPLFILPQSRCFNRRHRGEAQEWGTAKDGRLKRERRTRTERIREVKELQLPGRGTLMLPYKRGYNRQGKASEQDKC